MAKLGDVCKKATSNIAQKDLEDIMVIILFMVQVALFLMWIFISRKILILQL